ncbi:MAG: NFACT family protein, partial [Clostridia bacterium]|nr:NFACT family protein [Clostridia bacterium]
MAFDAAMLICLSRELDGLKESRIEKIYQPSGDEIVIMLHSARERSKILINAGSSYPRIHMTSAQLENPQKAPSFCMLLRKHLQAGKLISCTTFGFERAIDIEFEAYDEMGFKSKKHLITEIMGKFSNIVLTDSEYKITAVLKPVDFSVSTQRQLLVGMKYELPPKQDKLPTERVSEQDFLAAHERASGEMKIERFIISNFTGIAPSTAKAIAYELTGDIDSPLKSVEKSTLVKVFFKIVGDIREGRAKPYMVLNPSGEPQEFSYIPLNY